MGPGSIVELTKNLSKSDLMVCLLSNIPVPKKGVPYTISEGPFPMTCLDKNVYPFIRFEELGKYNYNSIYFSELLPPQEVKIEDLLPETVEELV